MMLATLQQDAEEGKKDYFLLKSVANKKVMHMGHSGEHKHTLNLEKGYQGDHQSFLLVPVEQDFYIESKVNGEYLTVENQTNGSKVHLYPMSSQPNQKFRIQETKAGSDEYVIYTYCGKVLAAKEGKQEQDSQIVQQEYNQADNQKWTLQKCQIKESEANSCNK